MTGENSRRPINKRRLLVALGISVLSYAVLIGLLVVLTPLIFTPQVIRKLEVKAAVQHTFPSLCAYGMVVTDCRSGGCAFEEVTGVEQYEISCRGQERMFGPAISVDATTCEVRVISLTLYTSILMDQPPNWDGKLLDCPFGDQE